MKAKFVAGHIVSFKGLWIGEIEEITKGSVKIKGNEGVFMPEDFEGVKITKEILVNSGIKSQKIGTAGGADMWSGMPAWSAEGDDEWLFRGDPSYLCLSGYFNTQVNYVHELQNLYSAIKGKELTIVL